MEWTILIYAASDNDLAPFLAANLNAWTNLPTTVPLQIVIQYDTPDGAKRVVVQQGVKTEVDLGKVNMGAPQVLTEFLQWGRTQYPASQTALFLRGHGSAVGTDNTAYSRPFFATTTAQLQALSAKDRGFGYDSSGDFLDTIELKAALLEGLAGTPLDLLAFDACLLGSIEIGFQLRHCAAWILASATTSPGAGWDYQKIMAWLIHQPTASAFAWATAIIKTYETMARTSHSRFVPKEFIAKYTLVLLDASQLEPLATHLAKISLYLLPAPGQNLLKNVLVEGGIRTIQKDAIRFYDPNMVDVGSWTQCFLRGIGAGLPKVQSLVTELRDLQAALVPGTGAIRQRVVADQTGNPVPTEGQNIPKLAGLALYHPKRNFNPKYSDLGFDQATRWGQVMARILLANR